jgi:hypothetical protein
MIKNRLSDFRDNNSKVRVRTHETKEYVGIITEVDYEKMTLMCDGLIPHKFDMRDVLDVTDVKDIKEK